MNRRTALIAATSFLIVCVLGAVFFVRGGFGLLKNQKKPEYQRTRIVIPGETGTNTRLPQTTEYLIQAENNNSKTPLGDGEEIVSVLNIDFNGDLIEEQIIAYRNFYEIDSPIYIALNEFDETSKNYRRTWSAPTAAARPGTVTLYSRDIIGDRSICIILSGMNSLGEHTLTIFKWSGQSSLRPGLQETPVYSPAASIPLFVKIAELQIDGAIRIQEMERSQAYQLGQAPGQSFTIAAYGNDPDSGNLLDQIEIIYSYNSQSGLFEKTRVSRIPGSQIEQRRVRELLSGTPGVFEKFINDLWYYVSPQGTVDRSQYIYFDPANREIVFFGDENLQVFTWKNSIPTRYGLYISSQNLSVSTLSRSLNIELESPESIRVRVIEEVRLKIEVNESWDGSYRRAGAERKTAGNGEKTIKPYIAASYDSSWGRIKFLPDGMYVLNSGNSQKTGWYVFFQVNDQELLELRPDAESRDAKTEENSRMVYRIHQSEKTASSPDILSLSRIRLGTTGIQELHEGIITLTPTEG